MIATGHFVRCLSRQETYWRISIDSLVGQAPGLQRPPRPPALSAARRRSGEGPPAARLDTGRAVV